MTSIAFQYSLTGFYKAPVSKGLLGCMFLTSCALHVPFLAHLKKFFFWTYFDVFAKYEIWRLATSKTTFLDTKDLICGSFLIYYFRVFERRYGSRKYASFILAITIITTVLELIVSYCFHRLNIDDAIVHQCGSYGFIFPMFVNYFFDIPRVAQTSIVGVPVTGKTLVYLLGLQMTSCSKSSAISGFCGLLAGFIYRYNILKVQSFIYIPKYIARVSNFLFNWLLKTSPPQDTRVPMGATLEIQRQQQIEILEQQMYLNHARNMQNQDQQYFIPDVTTAGTANNNDYIYQTMQSALRHRITPAARSGDSDGERPRAEAGPSVKEDQVQQLVEMGFERHNVLDALRRSNNDINVATNMLIPEVNESLPEVRHR